MKIKNRADRGYVFFVFTYPETNLTDQPSLQPLIPRLQPVEVLPCCMTNLLRKIWGKKTALHHNLPHVLHQSLGCKKNTLKIRQIGSNFNGLGLCSLRVIFSTFWVCGSISILRLTNIFLLGLCDLFLTQSFTGFRECLPNPKRLLCEFYHLAIGYMDTRLGDLAPSTPAQGQPKTAHWLITQHIPKSNVMCRAE